MTWSAAGTVDSSLGAYSVEQMEQVPNTFSAIAEATNSGLIYAAISRGDGSPGMSAAATVNFQNSYNYSNTKGRILDYDPLNGRLWMVGMYGNTSLDTSYSTNIFYSDDAGVTWKNATAGLVLTTSKTYSLSMFWAPDGSAIYVLIGSSTTALTLYRGVPNASRDGFTWTTFTGFSLGNGSNPLDGEPDIIVVKNPSDGFLYVWVATSYTLSTTPVAKVNNVKVDGTGAMTLGAVTYSWSPAAGSSYTEWLMPRFAFRHTGDGKTSDSTHPDIWLGWEHQTGSGIYPTDEGYYIARFEYNTTVVNNWQTTPTVLNVIRSFTGGTAAQARSKGACHVFDGSHLVVMGMTDGSTPNQAYVAQIAAAVGATLATTSINLNMGAMNWGTGNADARQASFDPASGDIYILHNAKNYIHKWSRLTNTVSQFENVSLLSMMRSPLNGRLHYALIPSPTTLSYAFDRLSGLVGMSRYNVASNTWTSSANFPVGFQGTYATPDSGVGKLPIPVKRNGDGTTGSSSTKFYLVGGMDWFGTDFSNITSMTSIWVFDTSTNTWTKVTNHPTLSTTDTSLAWSSAMMGSDGKIYCTLVNKLSTDTARYRIDVYDPTANTWTQNIGGAPASADAQLRTFGALPSWSTRHRSAVMVGQYIYENFQSSTTDPNAVDPLVETLFRFDTVSKTWTKLAAIKKQKEVTYLTSIPPEPVAYDSSYTRVGKNYWVPFDSDTIGQPGIGVSLTGSVSESDQNQLYYSISRNEWTRCGGTYAAGDVPHQALDAWSRANLGKNAAANSLIYSVCGYNGALYAFFAVRETNSPARFFKYVPDYADLTSASPAPGSTLNTDTPSLTGTMPATNDAYEIEWEFATDSAFTVNKRVVHSNTKRTVNGVDYYGPHYSNAARTESAKVYTDSPLTSGTWYARQSAVSHPFRRVLQSGTVTISHVPSATVQSPLGGSTIGFGTTGAIDLTWLFADSSTIDYQTAFQVIIEKNSDGTVIHDSGKIAQQSSYTYTYTLPPTYKDIQLRWKVRVWDRADTPSVYSAYGLFTVSDLPVVTITSPAQGENVLTGMPTVNWTFAATGGRSQSSYRVRFFDTNTSELMFDSGVLNGTDLTYTPSYQILDVGSYTVQVDVVDSRNLSGTDSNAFTTSYALPRSPIFTLDDSLYDSQGFIRVAWTSNEQEITFAEYRVYRRVLGEADFTLIATFNQAQSSYYYDDYVAGSGITYEYLVIQVTTSIGALVESSRVSPGPQTITSYSDRYWLIDKNDSSRNIYLKNVTSDSFKDEIEEEVINVIGRGRHTDRGTRFGYTGTLDVQIRTLPDGTSPREVRLNLEALRKDGGVFYLRNPFGDVFLVDMGDIDMSRVPGVGTTEFLDVTIPYREVM